MFSAPDASAGCRQRPEKPNPRNILINITRRAAPDDAANIRDPVLAAQDEHAGAHRAFDAVPDTPEAEEAKSALTTAICQAEVNIMQAEPVTFAGALVQVETLCRWECDGLPQGARRSSTG